MGEAAIRIAAEEFLTPPELRDFQLAGSVAGRVGGVRLELIAGKSGTHFGECYQQIPLRVSQPFHFGSSPSALVYLLNPTAGLMDGDGQLIEIAVRPGAHAVVVGQSATRIHPALKRFATQQWRIRVDAGAALTLLPGPSIPFQGCRYYQRIAVELAEGAQFCLGDVWLAGRYARGKMSERFQFETIVQEVLVHREGRLIFRDRFCWRGPWSETASAWHFGDANACGSCFITGPADERSTDDTTPGAFFRTAAGDSVCRWRGNSEAVTQAMVRAAATTPFADPAWQSPGELAPCHWFSSWLGPVH